MMGLSWATASSQHMTSPKPWGTPLMSGLSTSRGRKLRPGAGFLQIPRLCRWVWAPVVVRWVWEAWGPVDPTGQKLPRMIHQFVPRMIPWWSPAMAASQAPEMNVATAEVLALPLGRSCGLGAGETGHPSTIALSLTMPWGTC